MSNLILHRLQPQCRDRISTEFLAGNETVDISAYTEPADPQDYEITPLINSVSSAMRRFQNSPRPESDAWLAPRVHASLRLTRRQASEYGIWEWLAMGPLQEYVRWRWPAKAERFTSSDMNRQAISRLWWGAELTRNGGDYFATEILFHTQDIQNVWSVTRFIRNRPVAIASMQFLATFQDGKYASGDQIKHLGKAFNSMLTATVLDSVSESPAVDTSAILEWKNDEDSRDETQWEKVLPEGPPEAALPPDAIQRAHDLLKRLAAVVQSAKG